MNILGYIRRAWNWIRRDGLNHIETSALLVIVLSSFMPIWLAAVIAFAVGICWELISKKFGGVANVHDVVCDFAGVLLGTLIVILL